MTIPLVYDPRYHTWDSWASLMVEAYAAQQLSVPTGEHEWQEWGAAMKGIAIFEKEALPSPYAFTNWQDWAQEVVNAVNASTF